MQKKLYRNTQQAWVGGVMAGLADYFKHDPLLFRLAAIVFIIVTGVLPGLAFYILAWFIIPPIPSTQVHQYDIES